MALAPRGSCLTLLFAACVAAPTLGAQPGHQATRQRLDLFGSVVQTLLDSSQVLRGYIGRSSTSGTALTVDPRPFHSRASSGPEDGLMVASIRTLAVAEPALLEARRRQLESLGVPEGDALPLNNCPGALVPHQRQRDACAQSMLCSSRSSAFLIPSDRDDSGQPVSDSESKTALVSGT